MLILLTGATGFLGRHILSALVSAGHTVRAVGRSTPPAATRHVHWVQADFNRDHTAEAWLPHLTGVEAVINAAGILRETATQKFDALHERGPIALFRAGAQAGVTRFIQISALGADAQATTRYHLSKKHADDVLLSLPVTATLIQPSLVYGPGGASAAMLQQWAALPLIPLPGAGMQLIQPVFIDDLTDAVCSLLTLAQPPQRVAAVGPQAVTLRAYLALLRRQMGLGKARFLVLPMPLVQGAVRLAAHLPGSLADPDSLSMLQRGNTGDAAPFAALLGHTPRSPAQFIERDAAAAARIQALLGSLLPLLRVSIALVWFITGIVSLWVYPVADSLNLLHRVGVPAALGTTLLYGAAGLDFAFGVATLALRKRRLLWLMQMALIIFYSVLITLYLPEFWAHPYGPILKNLPMLAAIWLLYQLEE
ncbi:MAG: SDR family oxidoreductase [Hydrogenophaga sp.]|nr:SDR family oxidoreductase [Hydrogenophaga sp.]